MKGVHRKRDAKRPGKSVLLVDDDPYARMAVRRFIEECGGGAWTVIDVPDAHDAMRMLAQRAVTVAVVDVGLKGTDGLTLTREMRGAYPAVPVLVFSVHDERMYAPAAIRSGAQGYLMKEQSPEKLLEALDALAGGHLYFSEAVKAMALGALRAQREGAGREPMPGLSPRERRILNMIGAGGNSSGVARELGISVKTVRTHRYRIRTKLGVRNAEEERLYASQWLLGETSRRGDAGPAVSRPAPS